MKPPASAIESLLEGTHADPFSLLGVHQGPEGAFAIGAFAASPAEICAAAANWRVPRAACIDWSTENPPLASSNIACAASTLDVAAIVLSLPSCRAIAPTCATCADVAPATACIEFSEVVKSMPELMADFIAAPTAAMPPVTPRAPPRPFNEVPNEDANDRPVLRPALSASRCA